MNFNPEIQKYLESLSSLSQSTEDFLYVWDVKSGLNWFFGRLDDFNFKNTGLTPNTAEDMMAVVHPSDREEIHNDLAKIKRGEKKELDTTHRFITKEGKPVWVNCRGTVVEGQDGSPIALVGRVSRSVLENRINRITGIANKNKMVEDILQKQRAGKQGIFLLLGLDKIAKAYSEYGKEHVQTIVEFCGKVLEELATPLTTIYHLENDIFAVCLENGTEQSVRTCYDLFSAKIADYVTATGLAVKCSKLFVDPKDMYDSALKGLANAKKHARSKLTFLHEKDVEDQLNKQVLLEELESGVYNDMQGFFVKYQPQVEHGSFRVSGIEALLRFRSSAGVEYLPSQFIPLLEQSGLMSEVNVWVLKNAIAQVKKWRERLPGLHVNVNFSLLLLEECLDEVIQTVRESGLPPKTVVIELVETARLDDVDNVSVLIRTCQEAGIAISVDDFGTGYSNLALLKEIKCNEIKIERTFISGIQRDSYSYLLVNSVIGFARNNDIRICCEGVETEEDILTISRMCPDSYQGFAFDRPCSVQEFENRYINDKTKEYKARKSFVRALRKKEKEHIARFDPKEILTNIGVGLCVIDCDFTSDVYDMHPDQITEQILGMPPNLTPIECNKFWFTRIKEGYVGYVKKRLDTLLTTQKVVQIVHPWVHPVYGEILLSFSGVRSYSSAKKLVVKGLFRIVSSIEQVKDGDSVRPFRYFVQNKYIDIMLDKAMAFMEINLSQNRVEGRIKDLAGTQPSIGDCLDEISVENGDLLYNEYERWWADRYLLSDREAFLTKSNSNHLISLFEKGENREELYCRGKDKNGREFDCRKVFYISRDELLGDVTALCVMYDVSEEMERSLKRHNRDTAIRTMCDEYRSIAYINLDNDTIEFYREDKALGDWQTGLVGYEQTLGVFADKFVDEEDRANYKYMLSAMVLKKKLQEEEAFRFEYGRKDAKGEVRTHEAKLKRDLNNLSGFNVILGTRDIEKDVKLKYELQEALEMAHTDHLTGLYNQQGLYAKCSEVLANKNVPSAVIFMDLDNFKLVNDMYGHSMGDKVLYEVGQILQEETRGKDVLGRYGGDEFVALIYDVRDELECEIVLRRIARRINAVCNTFGLNVNISASIGVAYTKETGYDYRRLKEIADDRLYVAKKQGKNRIIKKS